MIRSFQRSREEDMCARVAGREERDDVGRREEQNDEETMEEIKDIVVNHTRTRYGTLY